MGQITPSDRAVKSAPRGVTLVEKRRAVIMLDELELVGKHDVAWGMTTYYGGQYSFYIVHSAA
jgi:hypothetical protein